MEGLQKRSIKSQTCCLTGHRFLDHEDQLRIQENLEPALLGLISQGYRYFGVGGAIGFDMMAELAVLKLRESCPEVKLILVLPCKDHTKRWKKEAIEEFGDIYAKADKTMFVSPCYYKGVMHARDRHLVDCSSVCVSYVRYTQKSGASYTREYALQNGLRVIDLYKPDKTTHTKLASQNGPARTDPEIQI